MSPAVKLFTFLIATSANSVHAKTGAGQAFLRSGGQMSTEDLRKNLFDELAGALGHSSSGDRLARLEAVLRPMYSALPKNEFGGVEHAVVRYALHRFFVQQHGWYVRGLEPAGESWNSSSPTGVFKDHVPSYIQALLEEHLGKHGLGLSEVVVLAATLEDLIHGEAVERLTSAYTLNRISTDDLASEEITTLILKTYMMLLIIPDGEYTKSSPKQISKLLLEAPEIYPGWDDTISWAQDVWKSVEHFQRTRVNPFKTTELDFTSTVQVVEQIGEQYGRFQDYECKALKEALLKLEDRDTGRVKLATFYSGSLGGDWQFAESEDYLRHLGALDEADPKHPSVVIPNYITSRSNCLLSSSLYSICCMDECEELMQHLESEISGPTASPQRIAELVAALPSDTIDAPRNLSASLLRRLDDIAAIHGGQVQLHGRLFAQWMHHAYPRECPYPHVTGALEAPRTANEWIASAGGDVGSAHLSAEEMRNVKSKLEIANSTYVEADLVDLPWTAEEELVLVRKSTSSMGTIGRNFMFYLASIAGLISVSRALFQSTHTAYHDLSKHKGSAGSAFLPDNLFNGKSHMV